MTLPVFITVIADHDKPQPSGCLLGTLAQKNSSEVNYRDQRQFTFGYTMFTKQQFEFLDMMRDVHYRIDCIEQLLLDLIERKVVDFTDASVAGTWIEKQIQRLESNDVKQ
ncbi:IS911 orfA [Shigella sonnei]|uniref:hypothetical protein n=1 Tax=Shigella sonnei TaxID=624 RepID=UPI00066349F8|nr:hypothetical protein [Shigella sonnei]EFZ1591422.1 hypothetical protein [Shigella sonnei]CSE40427.1 IS911 orfA [Shigella sonnei]